MGKRRTRLAALALTIMLLAGLAAAGLAAVFWLL